MTSMHKLNDLQLILLSTVSQRDDCTLLPLPEVTTAILDGRARADLTTTALFERGAIPPDWDEQGQVLLPGGEERPVRRPDEASVFRRMPAWRDPLRQ